MSDPKFTEADADRAFEEWGCNCGPGALAAIMGMTLDAVRLFLPEFDARRYTSPTMMFDALQRIGRPWERCARKTWPKYGLVRIQWEGPWCDDGVPIAARYRHTHWVGAETFRIAGVVVFDINCMNNGSGWVSLEDWSSIIVPHLLAGHKRATGRWHITHAIEVTP